MKTLICTLALAFSLTGTPSFGGVDTSGGTEGFINAVKALQPLGTLYRASEESLLQQGYVAQSAANVVHNPSVNDIESFEIHQDFANPDCSDCGVVEIEVKGRVGTNPPLPGVKDLFQVDGVSVIRK